MMRSFFLAAALVAFGSVATACGDDDFEDLQREAEELLRPPREILIQKVVVHETDRNGCAWDGPTCTPIIKTGYELPDPYAIARLVYNDGTEDGPILSNTCQDKLSCTFKGFGFSLPDPLEESWKSVRTLEIKVLDKDASDDDVIGHISVKRENLEHAFTASKAQGYAVLTAPLDTRIVSIQLRIK